MYGSPIELALHWPPTRAEALRRAADFVPRAARTYAAQRNYDRGVAERSNVSTLSPYLRERVITEREVLELVLARHSTAGAEKFVSEIFWRTYWKGWLQAHPGAWAKYRRDLAGQIDELTHDPDLAEAHAAALDGRTGIDAFDAWARELVTTNYLHNHTRMWFASIWIFTLQLPWELGADFFMRNLLDGDPAANTLSWRWVAGLHTPGRTYAATRANIQRYTEDRFELALPLARSPRALVGDPIALETPRALPPAQLSGEPSLLVLHEDDLHGDLVELPTDVVCGVCAVSATAGRSPQPLNPAVVAFATAVAGESVQRVAAHVGARELGVLPAAARSDRLDAVIAAAQACGARRIIAPFAPIGPARDLLDRIDARAREHGLSYAEFGRRYDALSWPAATRGFFNLRSRIPAILAELEIGAG